jgi:hypothetical protein
VNANGECKAPSLKKRASPTANHAIFVHPPQAECHGRFLRAVRGRASGGDSVGLNGRADGEESPRAGGAPRSVHFMTVAGPLANCTGLPTVRPPKAADCHTLAAGTHAAGLVAVARLGVDGNGARSACGVDSDAGLCSDLRS